MTAVPMDPRIRERRAQVRRDAGRRRLRLLMSLGAALASLGLAAGVLHSPLFDVDRVFIEGATNTGRGDVLGAAGLDQRTYMVRADEARLARRLEALPWVESAVVQKDWPATVRIRLLERSPVAAVPVAGGGWSLADATGRVLTPPVGEAPPGMPVVEAPTPAGRPGSTAAEGVRGALHVASAVPSTLSGRVTKIAVDAGGSLVINVDRAPPVTFGPPAQATAKLLAVATLLARADMRGVKAVDVRVPTAPVLTRS